MGFIPRLDIIEEGIDIEDISEFGIEEGFPEFIGIEDISEFIDIEVDIPGFGDPGVEEGWTVLVMVMVLVLYSNKVSVTVTVSGLGLLGGGWTLHKVQVAMNITHCEARATAASKIAKKAVQ